MAPLGFDFIRSPGLLAETIFVVYGLLLFFEGYYILQIFQKEGILYGHFSDVFNLLTDIRIWSIKHRIAYTTIIGGFLVCAFLTSVYWTELFHSRVYKVEPLFHSVSGFIQWALVLSVSALEAGDSPQSLLGLLLVGIFPVAIIGSIFTIVRYTSEDAHNSLISRMATGSLSPYRILVINYQEEYDDFIYTLLEQSNAFIVLFAKGERYSDAESFKQSFESLSNDEYRLLVEELSYSTDFLFDQYNLLECDELYILSDTEPETDYRNLQLITEINDAIERKAEWTEHDSIKIPETVWHTTDASISNIGTQIKESEFKDHLHVLSFQDDVENLVNINVGDPLRNLDSFFNFSGPTDAPEWVQGQLLSEYSFVTSPLTDGEMERLDAINRKRREQATGVSLRPDKERLLRDIESRLNAEDSSPFYGVMVDAAGTDIPLDPATAYSSYQFETAEASIQITEEPSSEASKRTHNAGGHGDIFIVNYNNNLDKFLRNHKQQAEKNQDLFVFCSHEQVTLGSTDGATHITFDTIPELLELLFGGSSRSDPTRRLAPGDRLLVFLDDMASEPQINSLKVVSAINEKLHDGTIDLTHNDILLAVESLSSADAEEFRHLSVDKVLQTHKTEKQFLENLAKLRNSDVAEAVVREGKFTSQESFKWAFETASYFREYEIKPATEVYLPGRHSESVVGYRHRELLSELRSFDGSARQFFVPFQLHRGHEETLTVELMQLDGNREITPDDYLAFIPHI